MEPTYQIGSLATDGPESKRAPTTQIPDYREMFHPKDTGRPIDSHVRSEPGQRVTDYLEISRLVRPKKDAAA